MQSWGSYPSIFHVGHRALEGYFNAPVVVEEKIDGSQFSFGVFDGRLRVRSKGAEMYPEAPQAMFVEAVAVAQELAPILTPGWTYRGEYLQRQKHNTLAYDRIPRRHIMLFDVTTGVECYLGHDEKRAEAERIGLECVPQLHCGMVSSPAALREFLARESVLGGQLIEGMVIKQEIPQLYGADKKLLIAKFVSEAFKEVHAGEWRKSNPTNGDILERIGETIRTPARWNKAIQRLAEYGKIENSPRDIGLLLKEVWPDIEKECEDDIKEALWKWAKPHLCRAATRGLPEWYKDRLLESQFMEPANEELSA